MKRITSLIVLLAALLFAAPANSAPFSGTYDSSKVEWWGAVSTCTNIAPYIGREPDDAGTYPVLVYVPDSYNRIPDGMSNAMVDAAAKAGFVAVAGKFTDNQFNAQYGGMDGNAKCIFNGQPRSLVGLACARPKADCSKGVVVSGFSLGAAIALRAKNYNASVRAAYLMGINEQRTTESGARWRFSMPAPTGTRVLSNTSLRIVNGEIDSPADRRDELNDVTGSACLTNSFNCLRPDGSGWYVVQNAQTTDKSADHYYMGTNFWSTTDPMDPVWKATSEPWGLVPNLNWLKSRTN